MFKLYKSFVKFCSITVNQFFINLFVALLISPIITKIVSTNNDISKTTKTSNMEYHFDFKNYILLFIFFALWCLTIVTFCKWWIEKKNLLLKISFDEKNLELSNNIGSLNKLLELTRKQSNMTSRLLQYNIIFYLRNKDKDFMQYFSEKMYNSSITFEELKEYGFDSLFYDHYKAFVHSKEYNGVLNNNEAVRKDFTDNNKQQ